MSASIYESLSDSPQSIRVIRIAPSNNFGTDRVACRLIETTWDSCEYEALSYCWGGASYSDDEDNINMTDILLNGESWQVTKHLYEGLRQLCMPDRIRTLWVSPLPAIARGRAPVEFSIVNALFPDRCFVHKPARPGREKRPSTKDGRYISIRPTCRSMARLRWPRHGGSFPTCQQISTSDFR